MKRRNDSTDRGPGDVPPESSGSIEQELDMCEHGSLRGEEIERLKGRERPIPVDGAEEEIGIDHLMERRHDVTMETEYREGDEMSGDDHSSGLQGGEPEIENQDHIETGIPGDETLHIEREEAARERKRIA